MTRVHDNSIPKVRSRKIPKYNRNITLENQAPKTQHKRERQRKDKYGPTVAEDDDLEERSSTGRHGVRTVYSNGS